MTISRGSAADLCEARGWLQRGTTSARELLDASLAAANAPAAQHVFIRRFDELARAQADAIDALAAAGQPRPPLAGLAISVKDLFDVSGFPTTAGSVVMPDTPATGDSVAVARLRAYGAALVGHTNQSEFAFSGVGINPHHGTPVNPACAAIDPVARVPGGSTSGGSVSVAIGAAWAALGSDTGGSVRIPAALQGLVGFKNTQRLTPSGGCVPLSSTLDTTCAVTRSVRDAVLLHEVLAARQVALQQRPLSGWRFGVPSTLLLDDLDPGVGSAFERALASLRAAGASIVEFELPPLAELAGLNSNGGLAAAESWAWHRARMERHGQSYDPRVSARIRRGADITAADYIDLLHARQSWIRRVEAASVAFDAMLSPTVPIVAPEIAPLVAHDDRFFEANALLLRNPSVVNFLDGCALSLPCHRVGELPVGLMVWAPALRDDIVLSASMAIEHALSRGH